MSDWLQDQIDLGNCKGLQTYYLYILRHNCIDRHNGVFSFSAFCEKILMYMRDIPWVTLDDSNEVRRATDFHGVEAVFWNIAEREASYGHYYRRADLDPCGRLSASTPPRTLYIASMMGALAEERWCWRKSLEKTKAGAVRLIQCDVDAVNTIQGIHIPQSCVEKISSAIAMASVKNFEELETVFEHISGLLWDIIAKSAEALFLELEKAAHASIERPHFKGNLYGYCRDIAEIAEDYRHWGSHTNERDCAAYNDVDDIDDGDNVGFYDR